MFRQSRVLGCLFALSLGLAPASAGAAGGDVSVGAVTPGGDVTINGDSANNDYTITQNADGTVTVTGNDGTTVNGQASHTTPAAVTGKISTNGRGGDDKITVDGVEVEDVKIKDEIGTNTIEVKNSKISDKLDIKNNAGSIAIGDTSWGRRKIRKGTGSVNPANLDGEGGAGQVGTPPSSGGGKKGASKASKGVLESQKQGLPTANPGQRGIVVPELPNMGGGYGGKSPKTPPKKGKY